MAPVLLSLFIALASPRAADPLPLVVVAPTAPANGTLVLFMTGDGGWASLDREIAHRLAADGAAIIAFNSLHYFTHKRSSRQVAADFTNVARTGCVQWQCRRVVLMGYSMGADVMPFIVNQLAMDIRAKLGSLVLISLGHNAVFRFFPTQWIGVTIGRQFATLPPLKRIHGLDILCVYGTEDQDEACTSLPTKATVVGLPGNHTLHNVSRDVAEIVVTHVRANARRT